MILKQSCEHAFTLRMMLAARESSGLTLSRLVILLSSPASTPANLTTRSEPSRHTTCALAPHL